jgi:ferredoxin
MYFKQEEVDVANLSKFPSDKDNNVCPVNALYIDEHGKLSIDSNKCIKCGLCIKRCPVGAIYYSQNNVRINHNSENLINVMANTENVKLQQNQLDILESAVKTGCFITESNELFISIYSQLQGINSKYHDEIGRNLLIGLGCCASKRRIGDVYTRMDAIYSLGSNIIGSAEIEFGRDTLDASRGILDDIATMNVRYGLSKDKNKALVICLQLPNARQGYWQVIKDIKNVENIKIQTLSIGAMMILIWNNTVIDSNKNYYIDYDNMSLRNIVEENMGRKINIEFGLLGIFEPEK